MSGSTSTTAAPTTPTYVPMTKTVLIHGVPTEISTLPPGSEIQDGQHFLSANGNHCYKVPRQHFQVAVKYVNASAIAALASFTVEQLNQVLMWTRDRLSDKGKDNGTYLIVPVSKEKQRPSLSLYMKGVWALRKGAQGELAKRDAEFFTPVAKAPAAKAADPQVTIEQALDSVPGAGPEVEAGADVGDGDPLDALEGM